MNKKITIIGAGKMGQAIATALLEKKIITGEQLTLTNIIFNGLETFAQEWGATVTGRNKTAVQHADIILFAVLPQHMQQVMDDIKDSITNQQLCISIAAGVEIATIKKIIGNDKQIVRVMPNICAQIGQSASAWVKSPEVTKEHIQDLQTILQAIGTEVELANESLINAVTVIAGSGPAYVFYLAEILEEVAQELGIPETLANKLVRQTIFGSSNMLVGSEVSTAQLRHSVISEKGATFEAFEVFKKESITQRFIKGINAAYKRAKELNRPLSS